MLSNVVVDMSRGGNMDMLSSRDNNWNMDMVINRNNHRNMDMISNFHYSVVSRTEMTTNSRSSTSLI